MKKPIAAPEVTGRKCGAASPEAEAAEAAKPEQRPPPLLVTMDEAAFMLRCSRRTVDNLVALGKLKKVKVRLLTRVTRRSVLELCGEPTEGEAAE